MDNELDLFYKKILLKKDLIEKTGKELEKLKSQKDNLSPKVFKALENEIIKEYDKSLNEIEKIKN